VLKHLNKGCGVGVYHLKETPTPDSVCYIWKCNFVAVYLTSVQFILQLKLCLYTTVHLLLEKFKFSLKVILKFTIIMSRNKSWNQSQSLILGPELESRFFFVLESESWVLNFPTRESESHKTTRTPHILVTNPNWTATAMEQFLPDDLSDITNDSLQKSNTVHYVTSEWHKKSLKLQQWI